MESHLTRQNTATSTAEFLAEDDSLSPYEFWYHHQRRSIQQPELVLMLAVLEDALKCYFERAQAKTRRESKLFDDAAQWFFCKDDEELFSFENICGFLGLDPKHVRQGLSQLDKSSSRRWGRRKKFTTSSGLLGRCA